MSSKVILIEQEQAIAAALQALKEDGVPAIDGPINATYVERRLGIGEQDRGWVVSAQYTIEGWWEKGHAIVYVSDPDTKVQIRPSL